MQSAPRFLITRSIGWRTVKLGPLGIAVWTRPRFRVTWALWTGQRQHGLFWPWL